MIRHVKHKLWLQAHFSCAGCRNYQVVAANHTLVLNWNAQTVPLLRQIAINRSERGEGTYSGCVIALCQCAVPFTSSSLRAAVQQVAHILLQSRAIGQYAPNIKLGLLM